MHVNSLLINIVPKHDYFLACALFPAHFTTILIPFFLFFFSALYKTLNPCCSSWKEPLHHLNRHGSYSRSLTSNTCSRLPFSKMCSSPTTQQKSSKFTSLPLTFNLFSYFFGGVIHWLEISDENIL